MITYKYMRFFHLITLAIAFTSVLSTLAANSTLSSPKVVHKSNATLTSLNNNNSKEILKGQEQGQRTYLGARGRELSPLYSPYATPGLIGPLGIPFGQFLPALGIGQTRPFSRPLGDLERPGSVRDRLGGNLY